MNKFCKIALSLAAALALTGNASADVIGTNSQGWINESGSSNNSGFSSGVIANAYVGQEGAFFNDFFSFLLPATGNFSSATLSIWNSASSRDADANALFSLFQASGYTYGGLMSGPALGGASVAAIDTGADHYVSFTLNAAGLAALNSAAGQNFTFGGHIDTPSGCADCTSAFGYTGGQPAAFLTVSSVPEPQNIALLVAGLGLVGVAARRKKQA